MRPSLWDLGLMEFIGAGIWDLLLSRRLTVIAAVSDLSHSGVPMVSCDTVASLLTSSFQQQIHGNINGATSRHRSEYCRQRLMLVSGLMFRVDQYVETMLTGRRA